MPEMSGGVFEYKAEADNKVVIPFPLPDILKCSLCDNEKYASKTKVRNFTDHLIDKHSLQCEGLRVLQTRAKPILLFFDGLPPTIWCVRAPTLVSLTGDSSIVRGSTVCLWMVRVVFLWGVQTVPPLPPSNGDAAAGSGCHPRDF